MKILVFCLLFVITGFAQIKNSLPLIHDRHGELNKNFKAISLSKRLSKYPFNEATKIKIVSFDLDYSGELTITRVDDTVSTKLTKKLDIDENGYYQNITLNLKEITTLSDILFNTCGKYYIGHYSTTGCFQPRNAILFFNKEDKVFETIKICFECRKIENKSPNKSKMSDFEEYCEFVYKPLEDFFNKMSVETKYRN